MKPSRRTELGEALYRFRKTFYGLAAFSCVINILALTPSLYMLQVYDRVLASRNETTLLMLTVLVAGLFLLSALLEFARSSVLIRVGNKFDEMLSNRVFTASFERNLRRAGGNPAQATHDLTNLRQFLTGSALFAFFDAPWTPIYMAVAFMVHPLLGFITLGGSIILFGLAYLNKLATDKPLGDANVSALQAAAFANNHLRNAEVIEAMGMLPGLRERWRKQHQRVLKLQTQASDSAARISTVSRFVRVFLQSAILGAGALLVIEGQISPGMMIACSILLGKALGPVEQAIGTWKQLVSTRAAYARLDEILKEAPPRGNTLSLPRPRGQLSFDNVFATAPGAKQAILKGLSFKIEPGEVVGVIGPSASGKSTLARLVVGVWPAQAGNVRLDGADVYLWNKDELGPHIGYLPQDIELFEGTIAENIARFGEPDSAKVIKAAQLAGVHDMILRLPNGYDTRLGMDGASLSGGQRQRVALARAVYGDPALIVLDEPNSNLDDQGEAALVNSVRQLKQLGATVLLVTHRMNILNAVDKLMVVRDGVMVMYGARETVLDTLRKQRTQAQQLSAQQGAPLAAPAASL
ncbi:type I secretion system permease/ATPase [Bordetella genomosp. 5]|uniref:Type I secretion system permease/ATPase n=1 Tax=Bordetella genomosp. 5 TaxID=1395608 RepID=A0A261TZ60_9BORD|nr:type I secretion system permease/ATPase [Bordetella genomosp. 5]OZI33583.1 type I secretion system permease/ATPase [Bordetella genomosp. 5]OZI54919.1 type I secretion system permease/ATPase [Bordetella genomosp. 5]